MAKLENIMTLGEEFLKALQLLDANSLNEKELFELDDLKERIIGHFNFFLESSVHSKEETKDYH